MIVQKSIFVKRPQAAAFRHFTADIGRWWPLKEGMSFGGERAQDLFLEGRVGGRFFERFSDGEEHDVGRVTAYEPPARVEFTWRQPSWSADTTVEVRFAAEGEGTRVTLEHRGFEALGPGAPRGAYDRGWDFALSRYAA
ncbi:MAG TPA: SRPBCC domain-containing protein [Myxococcota bacterium]|nr:SRPBCC domain-containing protein [Myxococcota bacterium]